MKRNQITKSSNLRSSPMDRGDNTMRKKMAQTGQDIEVYLVAKRNKWHDVAYYCILVTQGQEGEKGKKKTMDEYIYSQTSATFSCKTGKMTVERDIPQLLICFIITGSQQFKKHSSWIKGNFRCLLWITGLFISYGLYARQDAYLVLCCVC